MRRRRAFENTRRVVIKVGSALIVDGQKKLFQKLAGEIVMLQERGIDVVVVSSGALALGIEPLGAKTRPATLGGLQAAAAAGQGVLLRAWQDALHVHGRNVGQVLLTHGDFSDRGRYLNARTALQALLKAGLVPVVNENDSVATEEICFGDNDRLAAMVASLVGAELLLLLTQVDGLMTANPHIDDEVERISWVEDSATVEHMAAGPAGPGTGGMRSKVRAAAMAADMGQHVIIAHGMSDLAAILDGADIGTAFKPKRSAPTARKKWIATSLKSRGTIRIDAGAARALQEGKSLLLAGVVSATGDFELGDAVSLIGPDAAAVGIGLAQASRREVEELAGLRTEEAQALRDGAVPSPLVHCDDLAIMGVGGLFEATGTSEWKGGR